MKMKGVTPVVATVLLMTITVAGAGTVYTLMQSQTDRAREAQDTIPINQQTLEVERCYNEGGSTHIVLRNANTENAINGSSVIPLLNGSVEDHSFEKKGFIGPQESFTINFSQTFGPETLVILSSGETQIEHYCFGLG